MVTVSSFSRPPPTVTWAHSLPFTCAQALPPKPNCTEKGRQSCLPFSASDARRYAYSTLLALSKPTKPAVIRPRTTMSGTFVDPWAAVAIKQSSPPLKKPRRVLKGITLFNSWNLPGAMSYTSGIAGGLKNSGAPRRG